MRKPNVDTIEIWDVDLTSGRHLDSSKFGLVLSDEELLRIQQYKFEQDRHRYCVTRLAMRSLLAHYMMQSPQSIQLSYGPYGKPQVSVDNLQHDLQFNVSHTKKRALFAFARHYKVGIDIEYIQPDFPALDIASSNYTRPELTMLRRAPRQQQQSLFFSLWTRKEAVVKATGHGVSMDFRSFSVLPIPISTIHVQCEWGIQQLTVQQLNVGGDFVAALAVFGENSLEVKHTCASVQDIVALYG